jgi:hypothetical protein
MTQSDIELELSTETFHCTAEEVALVFAGILREMRVAAPHVTAEEREMLRLIMSHPGGTLTVGDVFPDFDRDSDRDSEALTALRRLRTAQFIRPAERDRWEAAERIEIKPFARLVWDKLGEAAIFGDEPENPTDDAIFGAVDEPAEEEQKGPEHTPPPKTSDIDLVLPGLDEPPGARTLRMSNRNGTAWDEADVMDFLNDEKTGR